MSRFPVFIQHDINDCGPSCLKMIAAFYGRNYSIETLRQRCFINRTGVSLLGISEGAESIGFRTRGLKLSYEKLEEDIILPCIVHWNQKHFVVVRKVTHDKVYVIDPAFGAVVYSRDEYTKAWASTVENSIPLGICLQLEPTPDFYKNENESLEKGKLSFLYKYLQGYKGPIIQIILGVLLASLIQVVFPFLFQTVIDKGVIIPNHSLIYTILIAQLVLVTSRFLLEYIRNWIILHLGTRINIYLVSDFLIKLMKLPASYFESKNRGDLLQRVADHKRIEAFLTFTVVNLFHSVFSITLMSIVLAIFSWKIFLIFCLGSIFYLLWTLRFMKRRKELDDKKFAQLSFNQSSLIQLFSGMNEIKLNNCEKRKRWEWEDIQAKLFRINMSGLSLMQKQRAGALIFNQYKDVLIVFFAALLAFKGHLSLGSIVAISYVIGQLSGPIDQMIDFFHTTQDAKISLDRLAEVHNRPDEDDIEKNLISDLDDHNHQITIRNLSFQYEGPKSPFVLNNISVIIPPNKITAIVGTSGSGKTTLLKLLLKFFSPTAGQIQINDRSLEQINSSYWRSRCGVVMQDGYIFTDTIARNIALSDEDIDKEKLYYAARIANVNTITDELPLGFNTRIGPEGSGLSQGQKQRILIARAVYKNPDFLFFDEATNSLDANNEREIMENLNEYFKGRTVLIIAHRLSTVKNADQLIVLEKGQIVEVGTHDELTALRGKYFTLVKNQLELGV